MACPITSFAALSATMGGARALFFDDRRYRHVAWLSLLTLALGWGAYFAFGRVLAFRVGLEALSTLVLIVAVLRVRRLVRVHGVELPMFSAFTRVIARTWSVVGSPWVLAAKVWLTAMLVMEWRGKAHFSGLEYAMVSAVLIGFAVLRALSVRRRLERFAGLEALAAGERVAECPLGFGCEVPAAHTSPAIRAEAGSPAGIETGSGFEPVTVALAGRE